MNLSELKSILTKIENIQFRLPTGSNVPDHFHITEVGIITKHYIDCGGVERLEKWISLQLWYANDYAHRLKPQKLLNIIRLAENKLGIGNMEIEIEYQSDTIGKYSVHFDGDIFRLIPKQTTCLATDACGIPAYAGQHEVAEPESTSVKSCKPGNGCC
jgi:hypothetical protein